MVAAQLVDYAEDETVLSIVRARYPQLTSLDIREALSDAGELVGQGLSSRFVMPYIIRAFLPAAKNKKHNFTAFCVKAQCFLGMRSGA